MPVASASPRRRRISRSHRTHPWLLQRPAQGATIAVMVAVAIAGPAGPAMPRQLSTPRDDPAVITTWNAIAVRTIFTENATPIPSSGLYFGFVARAVYDAVATEDGDDRGSRDDRSSMSGSAAAASAAHRVLSYYFPASVAHLDADYASTLAALPPGARVVRGQAAGEAAAARVIAARANDGRGAAITLTPGTLPGQWRPTPPTLAPMLVPWLGFVTPFVLRSPTQLTLPGPDPLNSADYARDYNEVKSYGAHDDSLRSPDQTETALFFSANPVVQYHEAMRDQVTRRSFGLVASARAFALLGTAIADSQIACWRAKYDYAFWRPITAITLGDTDGNAATAPDAAWTPLATTPPYPEYVSGHACVTGAAVGVLSHLFGSTHLDVRLTSSVTGTTRVYTSAQLLDQDTMNARIWLGLHFRRAMTDGNRLGHRVADIVVDESDSERG